MLGFLSDLKRFIKKSAVNNDSWFFRTFYRVCNQIKTIIGYFLIIRLPSLLFCFLGGCWQLEPLQATQWFAWLQAPQVFKWICLTCRLKNNISEKIVSSFCRYNIFIFTDDRVINVRLFFAFIVLIGYLFLSIPESSPLTRYFTLKNSTIQVDLHMVLTA